MLTDKELAARMDAMTGDRVTREEIEERIASTDFLPLGGTMTLCLITLDNGFSVRGEAACVDPSNYDQEVGERYAYDDAFRKLWPLFGFLLAETRFLLSQADEENPDA